jgi:hypothetical protein
MIGESAPDLPALRAALNENLVCIHQWAIDKKITIAPEKSCIILYMPDQTQFRHHPLVYLNGKLIPLDMALKWLGVIFDPKINFGIQAKTSKSKGSSRVPILKGLTGTNLGHDMETILRTYKCLILSCMSFNSPIWFPSTSATNIQGLQLVQNSALRIATGCHLATPIAHLHTECKILPGKNHFEMLNCQFLAKTLGHSHCSREVVTQPLGPRKMKKTLYDANIEFVRPYLTDGVMLDINYKHAIKNIHSAAVAASICENGPNPVLGTYLYSNEPRADEQVLPRKSRCTLRQLRCGKSICPLYRSADHTFL